MHVEIVEVSPRDGLQNEPVQVSTADKVLLITKALDAGIRRLEVTSFVNPKRVPQMADAEAVLAALPRDRGASYIGLALNEAGFERALAAKCDEVTFVVVASETFNMRNQGVPVAETLKMWRTVAAKAKKAGIKTTAIIGASFGCPFEGEVPVEKPIALMRELLQSGPDEIAFADTIGCGVPSQVTALLTRARALSATVRLRCHFHDTRRTGIANAAAALAAGVDALDASIGGVGGCPFAPAATGNIATEDLVYLMSRSGIDTGVDLQQIITTAKWLSGVIGKDVPGALTRAGVFPAAA